MNNLADVVLEYYTFLNFCDDDDLDPDTAVQKIAELSHAITTTFTDTERAALQAAAQRALASWLREPDEHGYTPRTQLTPELQEFLEAIAAGNFFAD
jgi:hypothetical protein